MNPLITSTVETADTVGRSGARRAPSGESLEQLLDVAVQVKVRFAETQMQVQDILRLGVGSMIELNQSVSQPATILINGKPIACGEVVVVDGYYGVRVTEVGTTGERLQVMGNANELL